MNFSAKIRIAILLAIGLPSILGVGLILANQLTPLSLADDYRVIQTVTIDKSAYDTSSRDAFDFLRVELDGDLLTVEVSYGGSHEHHDFELIGTGEYMESSPIQTAFLLSHDSKGDLGTDLITK